jgi:hypothetical protein
MTWIPLINSTYFDGIKADVLTTAGGVLAVGLIVLGASIIMSTFLNR